MTDASSLDPDGERIVRRIGRLAFGYALGAGLVCGFVVAWRPAIVLTLSGLASIVNFRGLKAFVLLLEPRRQGNLGARNTLLIALRLVFLAGLVGAALILGSRYFLALILGFSVIPAALMTEAGLQACGLTRGSNDGG